MLKNYPSILSTPRNYSLAIIGAGPAGLACGIKALQLQPKQSVLILEKSHQVGGLCHTAKIGRFEFELGCNQPPIGFEHTLKTLAISHQFVSKANECVFENGTVLKSPFDFKTVGHCLTYPVSLARFFGRASRNKASEPLSSTLSGLNPTFANEIQASCAYPTLGADIDLGLFRMMMSQGMKYPRIPIGGMASVAEEMRKKFLQLGGQIVFNSECQTIGKLANGSKLIKTKDGKTYKSDVLISSADAWKYYPSQSQPGLAIASLLFAVKSGCKYPNGTHTMAFLPSNFMEWTHQTRRGGGFPNKFGFHCFVNSLPEQNGCYTISAYLPTPRGISELNEEQASKIREYVIARMESRIHDFRTMIVEMHIIPPAEYMRRFSMANNIPLLEPPVGFTVPKYDEGIDTYFIGSSISSSNVLAAVDSGIKTAEKIQEFPNGSYQLR